MIRLTTERRNAIAGAARVAGLPEHVFGRFIDTVHAFDLDEQRLAAALAAAMRTHVPAKERLTDVDLYGISRIDQKRRSGEHGRTRAWTVRLFTHDPAHRVSASISDGEAGPEHSLVAAMLFRDRREKAVTPIVTRKPRGPFHTKRPRPDGSAP